MSCYYQRLNDYVDSLFMQQILMRPLHAAFIGKELIKVAHYNSTQGYDIYNQARSKYIIKIQNTYN